MRIKNVYTILKKLSEILRLFGDDADFFMFNGIMYLTNIDWVEQLPLTKDKQVGEITSQNSSTTEFENNMSNKLPIGTKIYSSKERSDILIVEINYQVLKYYSIVEG